MQFRKSALFCLVVLLHAGLLLLAWRSTIPLRTNDIESLQLLILPPRRAAADSAASPPDVTSRRQRLPTPQASAPAETPQRQPPLENSAPIDWTQEAQNVAQHEAQLAALPKPRPLDDHERHAGGEKPDAPPQFGWDHSRILRVETLAEGGILIWLNDRCAIVLMPLPVGGCGIGKAAARGDLFDHMGDAPALGAPTAAAP